ncbi:hypothetical protein AVEN_208906-1 [Araneus ventricosus]|uniref:Uncharacterized protein n=1 Tax=Araneus ventricosus TaxID=182803 RepID=A0A4Y2F1T4_ARAVE|nr:hypothetical protein AVEN_208906-1 [Araneus ventricosus]
MRVIGRWNRSGDSDFPFGIEDERFSLGHEYDFSGLTHCGLLAFVRWAGVPVRFATPSVSATNISRRLTTKHLEAETPCNQVSTALTPTIEDPRM